MSHTMVQPRFSDPAEEEEYCKTIFKVCSKCKESKDFTQYSKNTCNSYARIADRYYTSNGLRRRRPECKPCMAKIARIKKKMVIREVAEGARCEICNTDVEIVNDYCPDTGGFRGTLCRSCDKGLELLGDTSQNMARVLNRMMIANQRVQDE